jgi:hypothetical protein
MRNYDTTNRKPFPRVPEVTIRYSPEGKTSVEYLELMAVVDGDDKVQHLSIQPQRHAFDLESITQPVQVVDPATGADIPGKTAVSQELMLGILAFLRADQKRRDESKE